jgi:hypothetical protein
MLGVYVRKHSRHIPVVMRVIWKEIPLRAQIRWDRELPAANTVFGGRKAV